MGEITPRSRAVGDPIAKPAATPTPTPVAMMSPPIAVDRLVAIETPSARAAEHPRRSAPPSIQPAVSHVFTAVRKSPRSRSCAHLPSSIDMREGFGGWSRAGRGLCAGPFGLREHCFDQDGRHRAGGI